MRYFKTYGLLFVSAFAFLVHQLIEPFFHQAFIDSYLDDFLFLPVVYSLVLILLRPFLSAKFILPLPMIVLGWLCTSFFTEWLFPRLSSEHTSDPWDILAYAAGGLVFAWLGNKPLA